MSLPPSPTHGCDELTVQELHEILGLTRDSVRQSLRVRNPEFVRMCSGDDPAQLERVRAWYLNEITMRGRSIRQRRLAGYLSSAFVADQCGLTKEQLCEVEMGKAPQALVDQVDQMLARMLGENLETT